MIPIPPLQMSMGSSAKSDAIGGSGLGNGGMGALNQGDWIFQTTENGDNSATPSPKPAPAGNGLMLALIGAGAWFLLK